MKLFGWDELKAERLTKEELEKLDKEARQIALEMRRASRVWWGVAAINLALLIIALVVLAYDK